MSTDSQDTHFSLELPASGVVLGPGLRASEPRHLAVHRDRLIARQDQGKYWWELRHCDYYDLFAKPKVVFQEMAWFNRFAVDSSGGVLNNTAYVLPESRSMLRAVLNSPLAWWYMTRTAQHGKDEVLRLIGTYMETFPMPAPGTEDCFDEPVRKVTGVMGDRIAWEQAALTKLSSLVDLGDEASKVLGWLRRPEEDFLRLVGKASGRQLSSGATAELAAFRHQASDELGHFLTEQLALEKQLATLVEDAYGLTPEERQLLRATRPVRDPIDVLEARVAGLDTAVSAQPEEADDQPA